MSVIEFVCSFCHSTIKAPEQVAGKLALCPKCQKKCVVPDPFSFPSTDNAYPSSPPSSLSSLRDNEEELLRQRQRYLSTREGDGTDAPGAISVNVKLLPSTAERDGTDAPGVISLIFGCLATLCALFGCLTFGVTAYVAVPFALLGGLVGFFGKGNMRVAGLLLNFLAMIPAVVVTIILISSMVALKEAEERHQEEQRQQEAKLLAETRKNEAEAERLRQQVALKEREAGLLEQRRQREREEVARKAEKEREEEERRALLERQRQEAEAQRNLEKLEAEREAARQRQEKIDREEEKAKKLLRTALLLKARGGFDKQVRERLQEIIDKYPDTPSAKTAQQQLDKMAK